VAKRSDGHSVQVDPAAFKASVHSAFGCADCHSDVKGYPHEPAPQKVGCAACHAEAEAAYHDGLHARARQEGRTRAATCADCHGDVHTVLPRTDPASKVHRRSLATTCGACHGVKFVMEATGIGSTTPFFSYQESVHGRAVAAGSEKPAVCTDCHHAHDIRSGADPKSPVFKFAVPQTCGRCHEAVAATFADSVHGQAIRRGLWQAPVCTDCHGIHLIKPHVDPTSSVAAQALARTTCAQCHEGVRLSQEFGVAGRRASTYLDSYHGQASRLGSGVVANCASCHGVHDILPSTDDRSRVSKANLARTCGECHPGAGDNFARGRVHLDETPSVEVGAAVNRWVRVVYLWLIGLTIGSMLLHNVLVFRRKVIARKQAEPRIVVRMTPRQRLQHLVLLASFLALVVTGFALKYPDSWLASLLGGSETVRGVGHRVAAVVLVLAGLYHVGYLAFSSEGRRLVRDLWPKKQDLRDLVTTLRHALGRSPSRPRFGRFGYAEKAEYWAVVWGTVVMAVTGFMAWFEGPVLKVLPKWAIDVAITIHFYEAILASLAILVWHFYHVIFDPDVYPMNWAWWDGRISEEHYEKEHPLALGALREPAPAADPPPSGAPDPKDQPPEDEPPTS
jgi:cytochrome b subunit of formate dehydrogenase